MWKRYDVSFKAKEALLAAAKVQFITMTADHVDLASLKSLNQGMPSRRIRLGPNRAKKCTIVLNNKTRTVSLI